MKLKYNIIVGQQSFFTKYDKNLHYHSLVIKKVFLFLIDAKTTLNTQKKIIKTAFIYSTKSLKNN